VAGWLAGWIWEQFRNSSSESAMLRMLAVEKHYIRTPYCTYTYIRTPLTCVIYVCTYVDLHMYIDYNRIVCTERATMGMDDRPLLEIDQHAGDENFEYKLLLPPGSFTTNLRRH
jgi:hypothetical protein